MFVAKLDPAGNVLWVQQAGGPDLDESRVKLEQVYGQELEKRLKG